MSKKTLNKIISILVIFIVLFLAGTFAYENYLIKQADKEYEESLKDLPGIEQDHEAGDVNNDLGK
jgi:uncharacterized protein YpmB